MLIANIGNQHFGNLKRAKELISAANDSGADLIKCYAITPNFDGPLDRDFYEMCSFSFDEYVELIDYAKALNNDLYYEIYGTINESLLFHQSWRSITDYDLNKKECFMSELDKETSLVLIGKDLFPPMFLNANIIHSMETISDNPNLERIEVLKKIYNRNIGYSDKTIGINACIKANDVHNSNIIEKCITLEKGILFKGKTIEENIYSVLPEQFEELANKLMVFKEDTVLH